MRENAESLGSTDCIGQGMRLIHMSSQEPALKTRRCCHGNQVVAGVRQEADLPEPCRRASCVASPQGLPHIEMI